MGRRARRAARPPAPNRPPIALAAFLLLTLAAKGMVLAQLHDHPLLQPKGGLDASVYADLARRVAAGDLLLRPDAFFVSPLYVYFLAPFALLSDPSLLAARVVQIVLGTAAVGLVFATTRSLASKRAAYAAAFGLALTGVVAFNESLLLQSALDPFLASLAGLLLVRSLQAPTLGRLAATGFALGVFALNRPNVLPCAIALAGACALWLPASRLRSASALLLGLLVGIAPAMLRNAVVARDFVPISSHGGLNFLIGNNAGADGAYRRIEDIRPNIAGQAEDARALAEKAEGKALRPSQVDAHFYKRGLSWIASHPAAWLQLVGRKVVLLMNRVDIALNDSYTYFVRDEPTLLRFLFVGPWLLVPLGVLGLTAIALRGGTPAKLFVLTWVLFALSVVAFFVSSRYRLPLLVPLAIGAGIALDDLLTLAAERDVRRLTRAAIHLAPIAAVAWWPVSVDDGLASERTEMILHLVDSGRDEDARALLARTESGHPEKGVLYYRVGRAFQDNGKSAEAQRLFEKALAIDPGAAEVRLALGQALMDHGRAADALPHLRAAKDAGFKPEVAAFDMARALSSLDRRDEARSVLSELRLPPTASASDAAAVGQLAFELGDAERARDALDRAVAAEPSNAIYRERLGLSLALLKRLPEAADALQRAAALAPETASIPLNLAVVYAQMGRIADARAHLDEALRLRPEYPQALALRAALAGRRQPGAPFP